MSRSTLGFRIPLLLAGLLVFVGLGAARVCGAPQGVPERHPPSEVAFRAKVVTGDAPGAAREAQRLWGDTTNASREAGEIALLPAKARAYALLARLRMARPRDGQPSEIPLIERADWLRAGVVATARISERSVAWRTPGREVAGSECSTDELRELVLGFGQALRTLRAERVDPVVHPADAVLAEADDLLDRLRVASIADAIQVVRPGTRIPVPMPLAEAMVVRWRRIESAAQRSQVSVAPEHVKRLPVVRERVFASDLGASDLVEAGQPALVADLPVGDYLLECQQGPTRVAHRRVRISELEFVATRWPDVMVVAVRKKGEPVAGAEVRLIVRDEDRIVVVRTDEHGLVRAPMNWRKKSQRHVRIEARANGDYIASSGISFWFRLRSERKERTAPQDVAHVFVDRPIYRRGQRVQGRIALIRHAQGKEFEGREVATSPLVGHELELTWFASSKKKQRVRLPPTDAFGVATFTLDLAEDAPFGDGRLSVRRLSGGGPRIRLSSERPFQVADFRRPPVELELELPQRAAADGVVEARVRGRYSSGGPAVGLRGSLRATAYDVTESREFTLGAGGKATLRIAPGELMVSPKAGALRITAQLVAPDGQTLREHGVVALTVDERKPAQRAATPWVATLAEPAATVAGQVAVVRVRGPVGETALVSVGRDLHRDSRVVTIPEVGFVDWSVPTRATDYPALRAVVHPLDEAGMHRYGAQSYRADRGFTLPLLRAGGVLSLDIDSPATARPGDRVEVRLRARRGEDGATASVALAIVDETVFELAADRTSSIEGLRPNLTWGRLDLTDGMTPDSPWSILGRVLTDGWLEPFDVETTQWSSAIGLGGGAGGKYGGAASGRSATPVRSDFRATAHFVGSVVTGPDGIAKLSVKLPEDLARWRLTAVAIDGSARFARAQSNLQADLPLSVRSVHPRLLRVGDRVQTKAVVEARGAVAKGGAWSARAVAKDGLSVAGGEAALTAVATEVGAVAQAAREMRGTEVGTATIRWDARAGGEADAVEHRVPVLPDEVVLSKSRSMMVEGRAAFEDSPDDPESTRRVLTLLGSRAAVLDEAAEWLGRYPYGCVEQTLSRMMPLFVAAGARAGDGAKLTEAQGVRVERGMERLRELQHASGAGFAWWSGSTIDRQMTAIAWTALAQARAAGIDPARYGLRVRPPEDVAERVRDQLAKGAGAEPEWVDLEYVVAGLRIQPTSKAYLAAVRALVQSDRRLAGGMGARAGLALLGAGDVEAARKVAERLLAREVGRGAPASLGERSTVRAAQGLELFGALDRSVDDPRLTAARATWTGRLLKRHEDGRFGGTYETAQALHALALDQSATAMRGDGPASVRIEAGGSVRDVLLSKVNGFRAQVDLPVRGPIRVQGPKGREIVVVSRRERSVPGSGYGGSGSRGGGSGFQVTRTLRLVESGAAAEGAVARDSLYELAIDVVSIHPASYVVIDCPLPAGFEVAYAPRGVEVRDDRLVSLVPRIRPGQKHELRVTVRPAFEGDVAWPPVGVEAMYDEEVSAIGSGQRLEITAPRAARPVVADAPPLLSAAFVEANASRLVARIRAEESIETIREFTRSVRGPLLVRVRKLLAGTGPGSFDALAERWVESKVGRDLVRKLGATRAWPEMLSALAEGQGSARDLVNFAIWRTDKRHDPVLRSSYRAALRRVIAGDAAKVAPAIHRELLLESLYDILLDPWLRFGQSLCRTDGYRNSLASGEPAEFRDWIDLHRSVIELVFPLDPERAAATSSSPRDAIIDRLGWPGRSKSGGAVSAVERWIEEQHQKLLDLALERAVAEPGATAFRDRRAKVWSLLRRARPARRVALGLRLWDRLAGRRDSGKALAQLIQTVRSVDPAASSTWQAKLVDALNSPHRAVRAAGFQALPQQRRQAAWPALVLRCADDNGQVASLLSAQRPDRPMALAVLEQWLGRTVLGRRSADRVVRNLPLDQLSQWPLGSLLALASSRTEQRVEVAWKTAAGNLRFRPSSDLVYCLAAGSVTDEVLSARLATSRRGVERCVLVEALAARGASDVSFEPGDPLGPLYADMLGAWTGEAGSARRVLDRLRAHEAAGSDRSRQAERLPKELVAPMARSCAAFQSRDDFAKLSLRLLDHQVVAKLEALSVGDLRAVLPELSDRVIGLLPSGRLAALWSDLVRDVEGRRDADVVVEALLRLPQGEPRLREWLRKPTEIVKVARARKELAQALFDATGRRVALAAAVVGDPSEDSVLRRLRREGAAAIEAEDPALRFDSVERALFDGICRRRGLRVR